MLKRINLDGLGIMASVACAIHCAILPLIITSLPLFGTDIINNSAFEYFMIGVAIAIGIAALSHGYRKHHRSLTPIALFMVGALFLFAKQLWHTHQYVLLPFAVAFILSAHLYNMRLCRPRVKDASAIAN